MRQDSNLKSDSPERQIAKAEVRTTQGIVEKISTKNLEPDQKVAVQ